MRSGCCFLWLFLVSVAFGANPVSAQTPDPEDLLKFTDEVGREVTEIRDLDLTSPVRKSVKDILELADYIKAEIREIYDMDELGKEGLMLQTLGLIPGGAGYGKHLADLLSEPVESRYNNGGNILYIASWLPGREQKSVLAHEYVRALQNLHFSISEIVKSDRADWNHDRFLAHQALMEGDRTVVMLQLDLASEKRHFSDLPNLAFVMQSAMATAQGQNADPEDGSAYLKQILAFPYGYGASFLQECWKNRPDWQAVNNMYFDLPASTEQILHPEKYFGVRDNPKPVASMNPVAKLGDQWRVAYRNVLGEFSLGLLLNLHFTEEHSRKAVTGWGGDEVLHLESASGRKAVFVNTVWDTSDDAEKFLEAMDGWFLKRFPKGRRGNETSNGFSLTNDGMFYEIRRDGENLYFILGLPQADGKRWQGE